MSNKLITDLVEEYNEVLKSRNYWNGSAFEPITKMSADERGRFGEQLLHRLIEEYTEHNAIWDADNNTDPGDGVYDIHYHKATNKVRLEVKTSGRTVSKGRPSGWQHENVYYGGNKWDKIAFIDYDANDTIFITIVDYNEIVTEGVLDLSLFGKNAHIRKNEEGKGKVDFSLKSVRNGVNAGVTVCYDMNNPNTEELSAFFSSKL